MEHAAWKSGTNHSLFPNSNKGIVVVDSANHGIIPIENKLVRYPPFPMIQGLTRRLLEKYASRFFTSYLSLLTRQILLPFTSVVNDS